MKRRKSSVKVYYVIVIICLVILFTGYGYIYDLSEKRKDNQEVATISLVDEGEQIAQKYNRLFAKIMSYFNVFFKETFKKYDEDGMFYKKNNINFATSMESIYSGEKPSLENLEIYNNSDSNKELYKTTVLLANDRKKDFFTMTELINTASRMSNNPRNIKEYADKVNDNMKIILFHTHGTESYNENAKNNFHSEDDKYNIIGIGNIIANNLVNYGFNITHLKDYNDLPNYNYSYVNSKKLVNKNLDGNRKNLIVDIHRDGADAESNYEKVLESVTRVKINEEYIATFSLIIGGKNENIEKLKKMANAIKVVSDELYPGLCRGIVIRDDAYFNQNISDYATLIEIGSNLNTIDEARKSADFISEILCNAIIKINSY